MNLDSGTEEPVEYVGDAVPGVIPDGVPEDPTIDPNADAGDFVIDNSCCQVSFSIPENGEPTEATGRLRGTSGALANAGLELLRADGGWQASACMPVGSTAQYWFEFRWPGRAPVAFDAGIQYPPDWDGGYPDGWDAGADDAGTTDAGLDDAGVDAGPFMITTVRASSTQPTDYNGEGLQVNVYTSPSTCP